MTERRAIRSRQLPAPRASTDVLLDPVRLAEVRATGLLKALAAETFDGLTALAARLLAASEALVILVEDTEAVTVSRAGKADGLARRPVEESFCQYVVASGAPLLVGDVEQDPRTRDNPALRRRGLVAWAGYPLHGPQGHVLGSFCAGDVRARTWTEGDAEVLSVLASAASTQVALHLAMQQERTARVQIDLLSDASALLLTDLDPDAVLRRLTELAVPNLARWCSAWLPSGDGRMRAAAVAGPPGQVWTWPDVDLHGPSLSARVYRSRVPESLEDGTDTLRSVLPDAPITASSIAAGCGPAYAVPLLVHGRVLGSWTLLRHRDDPPFSEADRTFAQHLAGRAGQALSLAQQHAGQREAARVLQHSLLPRLPEVPGLSVRASYRPAGGTEVGGDWFDLVALPDGRVALVIGDVMGRGVPAAAVMGQVRSAAHAYARMGVPPALVLGLLEDTVAELTSADQDRSLVTCFLGVHDPVRHTLTWASAGHFPPIARGGGRAASVDGPIGAPLGVGQGGYAETTTATPPGTLLVLFTDGLVEDRRRDLDVGLDLVCELVDRADPNDLDGLTDVLLASVAAEEEDDVALLLVRSGLAPEPAPPSLS